MNDEGIRWQALKPIQEALSSVCYGQSNQVSEAHTFFLLYSV